MVIICESQSDYALVFTKTKWTNSFSKHVQAAEEKKNFVPFRFGFPRGYSCNEGGSTQETQNKNKLLVSHLVSPTSYSKAEYQNII